MAEERVRRRLAAIAVADVVGYSRMMEIDEAGTLLALRDRRKGALEPIVRAHGGRIVKVMGDGVLIEFASAVEAVHGALELQRRMAELNTRLPSERRIVLRIGINLGDVLGEGSDIYGDGVNIAARLEPLSPPGGLCISAKVLEELRGKSDVQFEDAGEQQLKNISRPVRAFRFTPDVAMEAPPPLSKHDRPSIAVLPFANMSGDVEQQYFCDGITEDIITELSRFRQMRVVSRNSSARFRGQDVDMVKAGRELGADYLAEGSVRRMGARVRITVQLIEAASAGHVWAERYDCAQDELFDVQDRVVQTIVSTLSGRVNAAGVDVARRKPPTSQAAYDYVLRGDALPWGTPEAAAKALALFCKAIEIDPGYARAYALMSFALERKWMTDMSDSLELLDEACWYAERAHALDENDTLCQLAMVWAHVYRGNYEPAEQHLAKAVALNPNQSSTRTDIAIYDNLRGEPDKAIEVLLEVKRLDPFFDPSWYWGELGTAYFNARRYDDAIAAMRRSTALSVWQRVWLAASYALAGQIDLAKNCAAEVVRALPDFSTRCFLAKRPLALPKDLTHLEEGMLKAGLPP